MFRIHKPILNMPFCEVFTGTFDGSAAIIKINEEDPPRKKIVAAANKSLATKYPDHFLKLLAQHSSKNNKLFSMYEPFEIANLLANWYKSADAKDPKKIRAVAAQLIYILYLINSAGYHAIFINNGSFAWRKTTQKFVKVRINGKNINVPTYGKLWQFIDDFCLAKKKSINSMMANICIILHQLIAQPTWQKLFKSPKTPDAYTMAENIKKDAKTTELGEYMPKEAKKDAMIFAHSAIFLCAAMKPADFARIHKVSYTKGRPVLNDVQALQIVQNLAKPENIVEVLI